MGKVTKNQKSTELNANALSYDYRIPAYIDVLGWSDLINQSVSHTVKINELNIIQHLLNETANFPKFLKKFTDDHLNIINKNQKFTVIEATHFSDTIVLSYNLNNPPITTFLNHVKILCMQLLSLGYYTRGAIVIGQTFHHENVIFGPALINAYKLEREVAKYPRVIVQPEAIQYINPQSSFKGYTETRFQDIRLDTDGLYYVDILEGKPSDHLIEIINMKLEKDANDLGRIAKHTWMLRYLNDKLEEYKTSGKK